MAVAERFLEKVECPPIIWEGEDGNPIGLGALHLMRRDVEKCVRVFSNGKTDDILTAFVEVAANFLRHGHDRRVEIYVTLDKGVCCVAVKAQSHADYSRKIWLALLHAKFTHMLELVKIRLKPVLKCLKHVLKRIANETKDPLNLCASDCGRGIAMAVTLADRVSLRGDVLSLCFKV